MESNGINNTSCKFESEIVSYLYDELTSADRDRFENHLLDCTPCTDEFAGMSYSRYSVFEWQREEFAPMATPQIAIPYPAKAVAVSGSSGYFSGLRELLTFNWQTGLAAAGLFAIFIGVGFAVINSQIQTDQEISGVDKTVSEINIAVPVIPSRVPVTNIPIDVERNLSRPVKAVQATTAVAENGRSKTNVLQKVNMPRINDDVAVRRPDPVRTSAPRLSTDLDDDDRSLRLSDLFEEDDTKR